MRTTVTLDEDVAAAVREARQRGIGVSEALNALARRGLARHGADPEPFVQATSSMGAPRVPLDDVGEALAVLEGDAHA